MKNKKQRKTDVNLWNIFIYSLWASMHDLSLIIASAGNIEQSIADIFEALKYFTWTNLQKTALTLIYVELFICYYSIAFQIVFFISLLRHNIFDAMTVQKQKTSCV